MTRIGQVGVGQWGAKVLRALASRADVDIAWTAGRDWPEKLRRYGAETDGVVVAVPPSAQPLVAAACLGEGLPVFLEKPMALSIKAASALHEQAAWSGLPVVVDHVWLFHPLRDEIRCAFGVSDLASVETVSGGQGPHRDWGVPHPGLWDWAPHDVALVLDLIGAAPEHVRAEVTSGGPGYHLHMVVGGVPVSVFTGNRAERKTRLVTIATRSTGPKTFDMLAHPANPLDRALGVWLDAVAGSSWDSRVGTLLAMQVVETLARAEATLTGPP
mgnify:FL=1